MHAHHMHINYSLTALFFFFFLEPVPKEKRKIMGPKADYCFFESKEKKKKPP